MQIVSNGDNLHEMSNLAFWENEKNITNLLSAEWAKRVRLKYVQEKRRRHEKHIYAKIWDFKIDSWEAHGRMGHDSLTW